MNSIIVLSLVILVILLSLDRAESRPRAQIVGNHIMKNHHQKNHHNRENRKDMQGNKTGRGWRKSKHGKKISNRKLIKALIQTLEDEYEYEEEYEDYESPIIEIRFKRDANEADFEVSSLDKFFEKHL